MLEPRPEGDDQLRHLVVAVPPVGIGEGGGDVERFQGHVPLADGLRQRRDRRRQLRYKPLDRRSKDVTHRPDSATMGGHGLWRRR